MSKTTAATEASEHEVGERGDPDQSPRVANKDKATARAEISNFDIVRHYFDVAADRLRIPDDIQAVLSSSYREVQS